MSQTIFVFGCTGQDGSLICQSLLKKKFKVIGFSRKSDPNRNNHELLGISKDFEIHQIDFKNPKVIKKAIDRFHPSEIYNLGAQSSVGKSYVEVSETLESIVNATVNILQSSKEVQYDGKIFFAGSGEIYGETNLAAKRSTPPNPQSPYGIAKACCLNYVKFYREVYKLNCVSGILFNHESILRSDQFVTKKIIKNALKCLKNKNHKLKVGNIDIARDWGWADEYVEAMQIITRSKILKDQIICTGTLTKLKDFIQITFEKLGLKWEDYVEIDKKLFRRSEISRNFGNPIQLKQELGWESRLKISQIIENMINHEIIFCKDNINSTH
ncbi:GDP-mannose 4,6-dehydratase [Prochlorococcus marinus]|uniref:GDP-mannose 4,6-dehydratase n=1 Tax=Prochlorococcus marinus TaxID=1219 RepID=UPI0022B51367|nr:GDP-mannose 4,6-dehydratase [Prochlorococcus marinus]